MSTCNKPGIITSYGVICYRFKYDNRFNCAVPEYLMIQRKDSVCFIEFLRGKYSLSNKPYMLTLFQNMTQHERNIINTNAFEDIWSLVWNKSHRVFSDHHISREKFNTLKTGIIDADTDIVFDIQFILNNTTSVMPEQQWEFPKGRRSIHETNVDCAVREFEEETGVNRSCICMSNKYNPMYMDKLGCNGILYRSMLFVAKCIIKIDPYQLMKLTAIQQNEVRCVKWLDYGSVITRLHTNDQVHSFEKLNKRIIGSMLDAI